MYFEIWFLLKFLVKNAEMRSQKANRSLAPFVNALQCWHVKISTNKKTQYTCTLCRLVCTGKKFIIN